MDTVSTSFIQNLASQTEIVDYGECSMVTIPGVSELSEAQRDMVYKEALCRQAAPICAETLADRLRWITPPFDEEEENELSRSLEAKARNDLESDGCPPCYPPELEFPFRDLPQQYKPIIQYWQCLLTTDVVLCAQLSKWRQFRRSQTKIRSRYRTKPFADFIHQIRQRLQKYNIGVPFTLLPDPTKQNRLQNWLEYEDYCLRQLEGLECKVDKLRTELRLGTPKDNERPARVFEGRTYTETVTIKVQRVEREIQQHHVLLDWAAQERQAMMAAAVGHDGDSLETAVSRDTWENRLRKSRAKRKTPAVVGNARGSKVIQVKHSAPLPSSTLQSSEPTDKEIERARQDDDPSSQMHAGVEPPPKSSSRARSQKPVSTSRDGKARDGTVARRTWSPGQGIRQRAQLPVMYKTRSGRISKRPSRLAFT